MQTPCVVSLQITHVQDCISIHLSLGPSFIAGLALSNSFPKTGKQMGLLHQETDVQGMNASFSLLTFCYHFFLYSRKDTKLNNN